MSGDDPKARESGDDPAWIESADDQLLGCRWTADDLAKGRFYGSAKTIASFKSACLWAPFLSWKSIFGRFLVIFGGFWKSPDCRFTVLFNFSVFKCPVSRVS
jgi:hypothetical protein